MGTGKQITSLELNGRNFTSLYTLVPGAVQDNSYDPTQIGITGFASISFNGNRMEYNNIEVDGGNNTDEGSGGVSINTYPSLDSIAEFRVSTSNYGADMGKHAGRRLKWLPSLERGTSTARSSSSSATTTSTPTTGLPTARSGAASTPRPTARRTPL